MDTYIAALVSSHQCAIESAYNNAIECTQCCSYVDTNIAALVSSHLGAIESAIVSTNYHAVKYT